MISLAAVPQPVTVLYVEDSLSNQALMRSVLRGRTDVRLIIAGCGAEALELAVAEQPALVLLDRHLPDMTGDEVLERLRGRVETRAVPVIIMSGDTATPRPADAKYGVVAYLTKPYDIRTLLAHIDGVLAPPG